jgi:hypothetical protein
MTANIGILDRIGYIAPGSSWSWVGWVGVVPILTALFSSCPAYSLFGISTR